MHVSNGLKQFGRRTPETNGASIVASTIVTLLLFACAFVAMRTVGRSNPAAEEARERPVVVALAPPEPTVPPRRPIPAPRTSTAAPTSITPPTSAPRGVSAPPAEPIVVPRDTASVPPSNAPVAPAPRAPATIPFGISPVPSTLADTAMGARGGAPREGAAVSIGDRTTNTARFRDSVANARMSREIARAWMRHEAMGREKQEIETSQRLAAKVAERATTAGSREVHIPQGKGMNGVGAVTGGPSIGLPLFASGPSAAQRRINDSLDAEYQLRLRRLQDRIIARRDSARLDSLRRDSLARRSRSPFPESRSPASPLVQRPLQLSPP